MELLRNQQKLQVVRKMRVNKLVGSISRGAVSSSLSERSVKPYVRRYLLRGYGDERKNVQPVTQFAMARPQPGGQFIGRPLNT
jgi:hypothetical protein